MRKYCNRKDGILETLPEAQKIKMRGSDGEEEDRLLMTEALLGRPWSAEVSDLRECV